MVSFRLLRTTRAKRGLALRVNHLISTVANLLFQNRSVRGLLINDLLAVNNLKHSCIVCAHDHILMLLVCDPDGRARTSICIGSKHLVVFFNPNTISPAHNKARATTYFFSCDIRRSSTAISSGMNGSPISLSSRITYNPELAINLEYTYERLWRFLSGWSANRKLTLPN